MSDAISEKLVILFEKRRRISKALDGVILPAVVDQLNAASRHLGHLKVTKGHPDQAEVSFIYKDEEIRRHVVYLDKRTCTCRGWQMTSKPCSHALAVLPTGKQPNMEPYVDMAYSVQRFQLHMQVLFQTSQTGISGPKLQKISNFSHQLPKKKVLADKGKTEFYQHWKELERLLDK
jgi:hypothetical protein